MDEFYTGNSRYNRYSNSDTCVVLGWHKQLSTSTDVAGDQYPYYYWWSSTLSPEFSPRIIDPFTHSFMTFVQIGYADYELCPDGHNPNFLVFRTKYFGGGCCHSVCVADTLAQGDNPYTDDTCLPLNAGGGTESYKLLFCKVISISLEVSETTLKTKNKLTAEENSKLGSIANSEATETSLWAKIFDAFKNLVLPTQIQTPPPVIDPPPTPPPEEVAVPLSNTPLNLQVSPSMSGSGDCPTSNRITVFAHDYSISNEPFCNLARGVRSIVIASAQVGAAWLILGAL